VLTRSKVATIPWAANKPLAMYLAIPASICIRMAGMCSSVLVRKAGHHGRTIHHGLAVYTFQTPSSWEQGSVIFSLEVRDKTYIPSKLQDQDVYDLTSTCSTTGRWIWRRGWNWLLFRHSYGGNLDSTGMFQTSLTFG